MKTTFKHLAIIIALVLVSAPSFGWGRRAHSAIAYIAESHLTPKAKKTLDELLDGKSIVYYASWLDDYRKEMLVEYTNKKGELKSGTIPHSFKLDKEGKVIVKKGRNTIDIINKSIENLENIKNLDDSTKLASIQCLIHLIGDIHCPAHVKYADYDAESVDKKYDQTKVKYGKKTVKMHKVWDSMVVDVTTPGGVCDLAYLIDRSSKKEVKVIQKGTPTEWAQQTADSSKDRWYIHEEQEMTRKYFLDNREYAFSQIEKAGLRLAKVLNDLFD